MNKETIAAIIEELKSGRTPKLTVEDVPAFSADATAGNEHMSPTDLDAIAAAVERKV